MPEFNKSTHQHQGKSSEKLLNKEKILNALNITQGQTILDAGCGNGYMAKEFAKSMKKTGKVYAMDTDNASIEALRATLESNTIEAITGDITSNTRLAPSSVDLVYLSTVLHGFSEKQMQGFIKEVQRLLKPKGILAILEIKKKDTPFGPPLSIRLSPEELKEKMPFVSKSTIDINEYFYMQIFEKPQ
jgi:ubiquinone/menaquinone biosynthesis C-methylase UbiE